uniref:Phage ABA sandwich domain-containing protein n=1 Tax=viral metagenome TaxID=1070528 RepID=A0A6M3L7S7_9ZZZZ
MLKLENYDERVAIEIMGWEKPPTGRYWALPGKKWSDAYTGYMQKDAVLGVIWQPSERIEQAIMVVEKMRQDGFSFSACNDNFPEDKKEWYVEFSNDTIQRGVYAGTISLAICQAAVLTKGEQRGVYAGTISLAICQMAY